METKPKATDQDMMNSQPRECPLAIFGDAWGPV
jgi:hypothetical protein